MESVGGYEDLHVIERYRCVEEMDSEIGRYFFFGPVTNSLIKGNCSSYGGERYHLEVSRRSVQGVYGAH